MQISRTQDISQTYAQLPKVQSPLLFQNEEHPDLSIKWGEISLEDIKRSGSPYQVTLPHTNQRNS